MRRSIPHVRCRRVHGVITLAGVVVAGETWRLVLAYVLVSIGLFVVGLWKKGAVKRLARFALGPLENGPSSTG